MRVLMKLDDIIDRENLRTDKISNYERYKEYYKDYYKSKRTEESRKQAHQKFIDSFSSKEEYLKYCKENNAKYRERLKQRRKNDVDECTKDYLEMKNISAKLWIERNPQKYMLNISKARAKQKGLEFTLKEEDIFIPEYCPILGVKLERKGKARHERDNSPSIDRIDNTKGYIKGNIIVISTRANRLKSDASIEELQKIAEFYKNLYVNI